MRVLKVFKGNKIGDTDAVMACVKHFAAYGAAVGGRDYNSVDMSYIMLWKLIYLLLKAALDAGAATFMNSFNDLNGIPATGNTYLQRDILKENGTFKGFVVSDWGSIGEMIAHGYSKDSKEAAFQAITAGSDMDMESNAYRNNLEELVKENKISIDVIDDAVRRILYKKFELGLFDDPFKFSNPERQKKQLLLILNILKAREVASKSIVLLKNDKNILPLSKDTKTIAFIGPMVKPKQNQSWLWAIDLKMLILRILFRNGKVWNVK